MTTLRAKLATARAQPPGVLLWLAPVWLLLAGAALTIRLVPFRRFARHLGSPVGPVALLPLAGEGDLRRARRLAAAIGIAARYAPFRSNCYPQALVAVLLCRLHRLPFALHFGAVRGPAALEAHAWVMCGRVAVAGGAVSFARFTPVACFARLRGSAASPN